jgi:precorrin-8X/cobalt-precorrin-8 methylmutase
MEWHIIDAQNLAIVDREVGDRNFSPAEYEIVRRVIYATADFEYKHLIHFSPTAMQAGAAAIAARCTIVVDVPTVQVGILPQIQNTFANPVYCSLDAIARPQKEKTRTAWGIETLAKRYPEAVFALGQDQSALSTLIDLIATESIKPALVIATPVGFVDVDATKKHLQEFSVPQIWTEGCKGGATVAAAILEGLVDLAWVAYAQEGNRE